MRCRELALVLAAVSCGCHRDMMDQPRYEYLSPSSRWSDGSAARPIPEGSIARDAPEAYAADGGNPIAWTQSNLERGQERYQIYCSPCHGALGDGDGMIVQRGFQRPPSYHEQRLRDAPDAHLFQVISQGFGKMLEYGSDIEVSDRWRIAMYVRALQRSQNAGLADVPDPQRAALGGSGP
jgi:mono/diheme cytochrome c family protein